MTLPKSPSLRRVLPWRWNWRWRITDNQWRKAMWERSAPVIVAIALLVALAAGAWGVIQSQASAHSSALAATYGKVAVSYGAENHTLLQRIKLINHRHHMESVQQNKDIEFALAVIAQYAKAIQQAQQDHALTLNEIAALQKEVANVFLGIPGDIAAVTAGQDMIVKALDWLECAQISGSTACGPAPRLP